MGLNRRPVLLAFALLVTLGGSNAVAVRLSNLELPPFWGAASRFILAALIFWAVVLFRRIEIPKGRAFYGTLLYGALSVGVSYAFLYWGLLEIQAGLAMVISSTVPLLTLLFARLHGIEPFRWRSLLGSMVALAGIVVAVSNQLGSRVPVVSLAAVLAGWVCAAEGSVIFKTLPKVHPVATNALAVSTGALILLVLSFLAGEQWGSPFSSAAAAPYLYLVLVGTVTLFYLYLFVLNRWSATATSYAFLLFPISTVVLGALLLGEEVTVQFLLGAVLVVAGVWIGAFRQQPSPVVSPG